MTKDQEFFDQSIKFLFRKTGMFFDQWLRDLYFTRLSPYGLKDCGMIIFELSNELKPGDPMPAIDFIIERVKKIKWPEDRTCDD